jgi:hypothetical protein
LIPRAAFFISDFPFVAFVPNRMSIQQKDLPDITLLRRLELRPPGEWQLAAYWDRHLPFPTAHCRQMWWTNLIIRMFS